MIECVINVSEGRDHELLSTLGSQCPHTLRDVHTDPHHHRSVFTLVGSAEEVEAEACSLAIKAIVLLDLSAHHGVHPRLGVVDVVPFVPLTPDEWPTCEAAQHHFGHWLAETLAVPSFLYGPHRPLPEVRREAFRSLSPDFGPPSPHPTAGATALGLRPILVAYNVWFDTDDLALVRNIARAVRTPHTRTLGLAVGRHTQVSCNLIDPLREGPGAAYRRIAEVAALQSIRPLRAELVGLVPCAVLEAESPDQWDLLDLSPEKTIENALTR